MLQKSLLWVSCKCKNLLSIFWPNRNPIGLFLGVPLYPASKWAPLAKYLCFFLLLFSAFGPLYADPSGSVAVSMAPSATPAVSPAPAPSNRYYLELAGGIDLPVSGWQNAYSLGPGFKVSAGLSLDPPWSLQLDLETIYFTGTNDAGKISDEEILVLPMMRYQFGGDVFRPYLLAGLGGEFEVLSGPPSGTAVADFDGALGAGCETGLGHGFSIFLEGKYNLIFSSKVVGQDMPFWLGLHWELP